MNVELLQKVKKHILEEPRRFAMEWWYGEAKPGKVPDMFEEDSKAPRCGTVGCIAGWAVVLSHKGKESLNSYDIESKAIELLQIDRVQARALFGVCQWPEQFLDSYENSTTRRGKATIAAKRIDHFIATKGTE